MDRTDLLERLRAGASTAFDGTNVVFAYLIGSVARGQMHARSDIDIAVYLDPPPIAQRTVDEQLALTARLRHATGLQTEIVVLNGASLPFAGRAISERIVIFSRDEPARVSYESCTHREFLDFQIHAERLDRDLLRRIAEGTR